MSQRNDRWPLLLFLQPVHKAKNELFSKVEPDDLVKFGLIPELVGRLPIIAVLQELDLDQLVQILTTPKDAITKQYQFLLELDQGKLEFTPEALKKIAQKAIERKTGARGLRAIIENLLLDLMYQLPSQDKPTKIVIDEKMLENSD